MFLYHVNRDYTLIPFFTPQLPSLSITDDEDSETKRICLSESIDGCFSAVYFGGAELKYSMWLNSYYDDNYQKEDKGKYAKYHLYVFDSTKISSSNIIPTEILSQNKLVADAHITKECWVVNETLTPAIILEIEVHDFDNIRLPYQKNKSGENKLLFCNRNIKGKITKIYQCKENSIIEIKFLLTDELIIFENEIKKMERFESLQNQ